MSSSPFQPDLFAGKVVFVVRCPLQPHFVENLRLEGCGRRLGKQTGTSAGQLYRGSGGSGSGPHTPGGLREERDGEGGGEGTNFATSGYLASTGGGTGICRGIVSSLMQHGASTVILGRRLPVLEATAAELEKQTGQRCLPVQGDVRDLKSLEAAVKKAVEVLGRIDCVVAGAAGNFLAPLEGLSSNAFRTVLEIDTLGTYNTFKATIGEVVKSRGSYLAISATLHYKGTPLQAHVSAAKAGVDALMRVIAVEYGPRGVRANVIAPGPIEGTEGIERLVPADVKAKHTKLVPMQRYGTVDDIAQSALFLLSPAASYITGTCLVVDGGSKYHLSGEMGSAPYPEMFLPGGEGKLKLRCCSMIALPTFGSVWDGSSSPLLAQVGSAHGYLASRTPHPSLPFSLFAIAHAIRVACVYRGISKAGGYDAQLGNLQAAIVPLVLILGGSTVSSTLLGLVPGWVITPVPVLTYGVLPLLAHKFGLTSLLLSLPSLPRETVFCLIDGFSRIMGMTTLGVDVVLAHPNQAVRTSPWAMVLVAFISGGGGGMIVPAFRLFGPEWGFTGTPAWVKMGMPIDVWSAGFIGYVYATLIDAHPFFRQLPAFLLEHVPIFKYLLNVPKAYLTSPTGTALLSPAEAKTFCSLLLAFMLFTTRIGLPLLKTIFAPSPAQKSKAKAAIQAKQQQAQKAVASSSAVANGKKAAQGLKERKAQ
ncbi:hypothetical protein JCM10213v2_004971 [Rhodosporidiobolus nylandii]